ncbi:hypothetical protein EYF80_040189 [Liparis tanakae]|uniref:Uncharacterized protein n=1 Tax=Liparis tanakae TaxID=230148 RepID=A0A4Z2G8N6_9TELE|nr:hypothetical protein EYF80_040189 [Liparis tanakae]
MRTAPPRVRRRAVCTNLVDGIRVLRHVEDDGGGAPLHGSPRLHTEEYTLIIEVSHEALGGDLPPEESPLGDTVQRLA